MKTKNYEYRMNLKRYYDNSLAWTFGTFAVWMIVVASIILYCFHQLNAYH